jgi:hypothetical protein
MTWVASAIGGGAVLGAGGSIVGGIMGSNAAGKAAGQQQSALYAALGQQQSTQNTLLNYFDPFRTMGLQAGQALTGELYNPQQQVEQSQATLDTLNQKMKSLLAARNGLSSGQDVPLLTGDKASERRKVIWDQMLSQNDQQQRDIQDQIAAQQGNLKRAQAQAANPQSQTDMITGNPMYTAASNAASRHLAAQGLQGSQEAIRQEGTLAANVYQNQLQNQLGIYQPTVGATAQIAGLIGNMGQGMAQTLGNIGGAQAQGTIGSANAWTGAISGAANAASGAGSALLNYSLYNKLIGNMNTGNANTGGGAVPFAAGFNAPSAQNNGMGQPSNNFNNFGMGT